MYNKCYTLQTIFINRYQHIINMKKSKLPKHPAASGSTIVAPVKKRKRETAAVRPPLSKGGITRSHDGYCLQHFITMGNTTHTPVSLARLLGVNRHSLYYAYGNVTLPAAWVKMFEGAGIFIPGINAPGGPELPVVTEMRQRLEKRITELENTVASQKAELIKQAAELNAYNRILNSGSKK